MKKIKVAQIGAGHDHASITMKSLKFHSDIYDIVGYAVVPGDEEVYEINKDLYDGINRMSVDEILNFPDLDAVFIETEDRRLTEYAIKAAERGLHIHMDTPGSQSDEDFDKLVNIVKQNNLVFQLGYMYRYNPAVLKLKKDIDEGRLGKIYAVEAQMNCIHSVSKRQWLGNYTGGMLYFLGCHLIDLVYSIMGNPDEVIPMSTPIGTDGVTGEDFGMAIFKYNNVPSFVKTTAVEIGGFERRQLVVCGTKGTVELKPFEWVVEELPDRGQMQRTDVVEAFDEAVKTWHIKGNHYSSPVHGRYDAMLRAFAAYVNGEEENPFDYEYERKLHKLILKACGA